MPELITEFYNDDATLKVVWEYHGEGWHGDFDPTDVMDEPLARFTCYRATSPDFWVMVPDSSFCTMLRRDSSQEWMRYISYQEIFPAIGHPNQKGLLHDMTYVYSMEYFISREMVS